MRKTWFIATSLMMAFLAFAASIATGEEVIRLRAPAVAGSYYPAEPQVLRDTLTRFYEKVPPTSSPGLLRASIVPHAAYGFAGETIAHAFKHLRPGQFERVIIIAPSNFAVLEGCSVPDVEGFITPVGVVEVDRDALRILTFSPHFTLNRLQSGVRTRKQGIHEEEFSIEVLLPFLQHRLGAFKLVPILVGEFTRAGGGLDHAVVENVVTQIQRVVDEKTLLVASSNFTQYGESFGYVPFRESIFAQIEQLDKHAIALVISRNTGAFAEYLETTRNPIVGHMAIQLLMRLLPPSSQGSLLHYDHSGRMMKTTERSVSYAAINYYAPAEVSAP